MISRRRFTAAALVALVVTSPLHAAKVQTRNFVVDAPTAEVAKQFGQMAEYYRKEKALQWLGAEMPPWPQPCPLFVKPALRPGGATKFDYTGGSYVVLSMEIEGDLERMLNSVLPHEVTHTVFAHHFRYPVPRWADEGGSVLSEDDVERQRHDQMCRNFLNAGQALTLRRLFTVKEYYELQDKMIVLYAQGYSVSNYLIGISDRATYLQFVGIGMRGNWDQAVQTCYRLRSVDELEERWLKHLRDTKKGATTILASNQQGNRPVTDAARRDVVRLTIPPAQPQLDPAGPVYRGQGEDGHSAGRPTHLPPTVPVAVAAPTTQPTSHRQTGPPAPIILGAPEFAPAPQRSQAQKASPPNVGFQN